ncbi:MAG: protein kinase [Planctomycetes bacterium]|nr:protein kinase [Planctomycetota bacterium]
MAAERGDLLIGKIALRAGLITREQLYDCLIAQERNPSKTLGAIMVSRGHLKQEDVEKLLEIQRKAFETFGSGDAPSRRHALFGHLLIGKGLATEYQVNEGLRLQGRLSELGIKPVPPLGEILMQRGYLNREAVETALQLQSLHIYACPECGAAIDASEEDTKHGDYICPKCRAQIPVLFAKMAAAVREALDEVSRGLESEVPDEVLAADKDPANHFGKYILVKEIGRGGAGIVYRAFQKDLNRMVALKLLPHESDTAAGIRTPFGDVEDVKRFYNETRAAADLNHPNIVPILDFGNVENHFFYTMKLIEGVTLDVVIREGLDDRAFQTTEARGPGRGPAPKAAPGSSQGKGLPVADAVRVIREIALAVDYAHQKGVFHRDLKPGNIIIEKTGRPWVLDFGLAKIKRIGDPAYVKGVVMGTPYYMPPEQALGDMEQVDHWSDVYSLGAVLYEMLGGYAPYGAKAPDEVLALLPKEGPEPVTLHAPHLHADLVRVVEKAMRRDKRDRYPTARAFAEDLERFRDGQPLAEEPVGARPVTMWDRIRGLFGAR